MIRQAIEFTVLDEDDWQFEDIGDEIEYFSFEDSVVAVDSPFSLIAKHLGLFAIFGLSLILVIFLCIFVSLKIFGISSSQVVSKPTQTATYTVEHKKGKDVNSAELIDISKIISGYMYVLSQSDLYADLNNFCKNGSNVYEKIIEIQGESKFAYDKSDSFVRAYKTLAKKTTIGKISEAVEKDGKYYCYVDLIVPNSQALRAYMLGYSYEVTKTFRANKIDIVTISSYVNKVLGYSDFPIKEQEFEIEVIKTDSGFMIADDTQFIRVYSEVYDELIALVAEILGGNFSVDTVG